MPENKEELSEEQLQAIYIENAKYFMQRAIEARIDMPEYEAKEFWLPHVLDAFAIINGAIDYLVETEKEKNISLACSAGCVACCYQDVPVSPLEAIAVCFAVHTYVDGEIKEKLHAQLKEQNSNITWNNGQCPFLIDKKCAIYPLRPMACRSLLMVNEACKTRTFEEIKGTDLPLYIPILENCRLPHFVATHLAFTHLSKISWELGMIEQGVLLDYNTSKNYFVDVRSIKWLDNSLVYSRFLTK